MGGCGETGLRERRRATHRSRASRAPSSHAAAARGAPGGLRAHGERGRIGAEVLGEPLEHAAGGAPIAGRVSRHAPATAASIVPRRVALTRAPLGASRSTARRRSPGVGDAHQHPLGHQPLQHAGQGARMHVEDRGEVAGGDPETARPRAGPGAGGRSRPDPPPCPSSCVRGRGRPPTAAA